MHASMDQWTTGRASISVAPSSAIPAHQTCDCTQCAIVPSAWPLAAEQRCPQLIPGQHNQSPGAPQASIITRQATCSQTACVTQQPHQQLNTAAARAPGQPSLLLQPCYSHPHASSHPLQHHRQHAHGPQLMAARRYHQHRPLRNVPRPRCARWPITSVQSPYSPVTLQFLTSCCLAQPDFCMPSSLMKSTQSREPRKVFAVRTMKDSEVVSL